MSSSSIALDEWAPRWDRGTPPPWKWQEKAGFPAKYREYVKSVASSHPEMKDDASKELADLYPSVLFPLCGDSPTLSLWHGKGHSVSGVEVVPKAVSNLMNTFQDMTWKKQGTTHLGTRKGDDTVSVRIHNIDLFKLNIKEHNDNKQFDLVYDRASFVAINPTQRTAYVDVIRASLRPAGLWFLSVLERPHSNNGPPFSVPASVVCAKRGDPDSPVVIPSAFDGFDLLHWRNVTQVSLGQVVTYVLRRTAAK